MMTIFYYSDAAIHYVNSNNHSEKYIHVIQKYMNASIHNE